MLPTNACGPGGRGAEGRGDIIRAAPPPAATSSQALRSIHDIIGLISTPLLPGTPAAGRAPSSAPGLARRASPCSGHSDRSKPRGAPRWACLTYSLPQGPARGLRRRRHRPGSLAQPEARPPGRAARARLRSAALPLPARAPPTRGCGKRGSALQPRPPWAANPWTGAGRSALTPWSLRPGPRLGPLCFTYSREPRVCPELLPLLLPCYPPPNPPTNTVGPHSP